MAVTPPPEPGEIRQVLVHPAVWARLELFLAAYCNAELTLVGQIGNDDLPTYVMTPIRMPSPNDGA